MATNTRGGFSQLSFESSQDSTSICPVTKRSIPLIVTSGSKKKRKIAKHIPAKKVQQKRQTASKNVPSKATLSRPGACPSLLSPPPRKPVREIKKTIGKNKKDEQSKLISISKTTSQVVVDSLPPEPDTSEEECANANDDESMDSSLIVTQELEIPYALGHETVGAALSTATLLRRLAKDHRKEPLRPGDLITYHHPAFVAGHPNGKRLTQVMATHDYEADPILELENGEYLPSDTRVKRVKEYRGGKLFEHSGVWREITSFAIQERDLDKKGKYMMQQKRDNQAAKLTEHMEQSKEALENMTAYSDDDEKSSYENSQIVPSRSLRKQSTLNLPSQDSNSSSITPLPPRPTSAKKNMAPHKDVFDESDSDTSSDDLATRSLKVDTKKKTSRATKMCINANLSILSSKSSEALVAVEKSATKTMKNNRKATVSNSTTTKRTIARRAPAKNPLRTTYTSDLDDDHSSIFSKEKKKMMSSVAIPRRPRILDENQQRNAKNPLRSSFTSDVESDNDSIFSHPGTTRKGKYHKPSRPQAHPLIDEDAELEDEHELTLLQRGRASIETFGEPDDMETLSDSSSDEATSTALDRKYNMEVAYPKGKRKTLTPPMEPKRKAMKLTGTASNKNSASRIGTIRSSVFVPTAVETATSQLYDIDSSDDDDDENTENLLNRFSVKDRETESIVSSSIVNTQSSNEATNEQQRAKKKTKVSEFATWAARGKKRHQVHGYGERPESRGSSGLKPLAFQRVPRRGPFDSTIM